MSKRKTDIYNLINLGLDFYRTRKAELELPNGEVVNGIVCVCANMEQWQIDKVKEYKNTRVAKQEKCYQIFIGDKCFPEFNALEV